jgi:Bacterial Ig domain
MSNAINSSRPRRRSWLLSLAATLFVVPSLSMMPLRASGAGPSSTATTGATQPVATAPFDDRLFVDDRSNTIAMTNPARPVDIAVTARRVWPTISANEIAILQDRAGLLSVSPQMALAIGKVSQTVGQSPARSAAELEAPLTLAVGAYYTGRQSGSSSDAGLRGVAAKLLPNVDLETAMAALRTAYVEMLADNTVSIVAADPGIAAITPATFPQPPLGFLAFPYQVGSGWSPNGVHTTSGANDGSPMSSIDWSNGWPAWGANTSTSYVTAMHGGTVTVYSSCNIRVSDSSGWATNYYHLANPTVTSGQVITRGTAIGVYADNQAQALCQGGSSTGPHVHTSLLFQGSQWTVNNANINGWTVHPGVLSYSTATYYDRNGVNSGTYVSIIRDDCSVTPSVNTAVPSTGGPVTMNIATGAGNGGCPWEVTNASTSAYPWITVSTAGLGPASATITFAANTGPSRTGAVQVSGQLVYFTQAAGADTSAPTATIGTPTVGQVLPNSPVTITGTATDNIGVTSARVAIYRSVAGGQYWNGTTWQASNTTVVATLATPGATTTNWTYTFNAPPGGVFAVAALTYDAANNYGLAPYQNFSINDTTTPTVTLSTPTPSQTLATRPVTITGTATDNAGIGDVQIAIYRPADPNGQFWNGTTWQSTYTTVTANLATPGTTNTTYTYSFNPPQTGGYYYTAAIALDTSYRYNITPFTLFTLPDTTPPTATITTPTAGPTTGPITITGTATDNNTINRVAIAIYREATNQYWNGTTWQTAFTTFASATLTAPGTTNTNFTTTYTPTVAGRLYIGALPIDGNYNYTLTPWTIITAT